MTRDISLSERILVWRDGTEYSSIDAWDDGEDPDDHSNAMASADPFLAILPFVDANDCQCGVQDTTDSLWRTVGCESSTFLFVCQRGR